MMRIGFVGVMLCACAAGPNARESDTSVAQSAAADTAGVRVLATFQQSGWDQATTFVINDQPGLTAAWGVAHAGMSDIPPLPTVDFTRDRAVVVAVGMRSSGGYVLKLGAHRVSQDSLVIGVVLQRPGANCGTTAQLTAPAIFLTVRRTAVVPKVAMSERDGPSC